MEDRERKCKYREDQGMCPCGECRTCVENLGSDIDDLTEKLTASEARVEALEVELTKACDRTALLEAEMGISNPHEYKTALEQAFDDCSVAIDGDAGWQYAGQMVQAVNAVLEEREGLRTRASKLERELAAGKLLVHASIEAERVSPRLVAWAGEPDQPRKGESDG